MTNILNQHYLQILGLKKPWDILNIDLDTENKRLTIDIHTSKGAKLPCPICNKLCSKEDSPSKRKWRHLDTMQFETIITCKVPRVRCPDHGVKTVKVPWASRYSRITLLFERFAIDVINSSKSITSAMKLLRLSWKQIHKIMKLAVARGLDRRGNELIDYVGIDEKSFLKGHSYASILNNLDKNCVLDVIKDRTQESSTDLLQTLSKKQRKNVQAIALDMWKPFMNAATEVLPNADIVHDKYHVVGYLGKAVDLVRKQENRELLKQNNEILKGTKYLWLSNPDNLSKEAKRTFRKAMKVELKVGRAWAIKEAFRYFWNYSYIGSAIKYFNKWYFWATHSKLKPIIKVAKTIKRHFKGILAYLEHHITNAVSEGINSKIQSLKSNARGFRSFENYRISILFHCGKLDLYPELWAKNHCLYILGMDIYYGSRQPSVHNNNLVPI